MDTTPEPRDVPTATYTTTDGTREVPIPTETTDGTRALALPKTQRHAPIGEPVQHRGPAPS